MTYAPIVGDTENRARIQQLEAELEQLRAKVDHEAPADLAGDLEQAVKPPGLPKMVFFGAILAILSLGFFLAVYTALSKGFNSLATKAASSYANEFNEEPSDSHSTSTQPARPHRRQMTVPGL